MSKHSRTTSFDLDDALYKRVNLCAASLGMSSSEFIRLSLHLAMVSYAEQDPGIAIVLAGLDALEAAPTAEVAS